MPTDAKILVLVNQQNGVSIIPQPTPLTRLHYFDGKYLKASDLTAEQTYLRSLVQISNQAGGRGVAYGYDLSLATGDALHLGAGLAIDSQGRVLLLPQEFQIGIQDLLDKSLKTKIVTTRPVTAGAFGDCVQSLSTPPDGVAAGADLYLITICAAEALCGQEDVFGTLCEDACAKATDRPYSVEGILLRAVPLTLQTILPASAAVKLTRLHLRSRVASAYFEDERHVVESQISGAGLKSDVWCFGAQAQAGQCVPIGVLARAGTSTVFLDAWTARRERIDTPAKRYWQWRMAMRPWDVYLAQILQFQCQLSDLYRNGGGGSGPDDPCQQAHSLVLEASDTVGKMVSYYQSVTSRFQLTPLVVEGNATTVPVPQLEGGLTALLDLHQRLLLTAAQSTAASDQFLIDGGIISTPSAGYLAVAPSSVVSVNDQVRHLMGRGVDLRFCIVRPDFVPHALEEAQHMERISLIEGLDNPKLIPQVDVLVPNGVVLDARPATGVAYEAAIKSGTSSSTIVRSAAAARPELDGAAHILATPGGAFELFTAVQDASGKTAAWLTLTSSVNPFATFSAGQALLQLRSTSESGDDTLITGSMVYEAPVHTPNQITVTGTFDGTFTNPTSNRLTLTISAVLINNGSVPRLSVTFIDQKSGTSVLATATWSGSPLRIVVRVGLGTAISTNVPRSILEVDFLQNDDVLQPTNALHKQAVAALGAVGVGLKDPQFAARAEGQLFPPAPPAQDLRIQAVLDWVLFHRRRTKQCEVATTTVQLANRKFQLWHGMVANLDALEAVRKALVSNTPMDPKLVAFQRVDVVEFAPGVQTMVSSGDALRTDWPQVHPGQRIHYGAVANGPGAEPDGPAVALGRAGAVEFALASLAPTVPGASLDVLNAIPTELASPGSDGIMVMLTILETTCLTVIQLSNADTAQRVRDLVSKGEVQAAINAGQPLGQVKFVAGDARVPDSSLDNIASFFKKPHSAMVLVQNANPDLPVALAQKQGDVVHTGLGGGPALETLTSTPPLPACPVVLFVFLPSTAVPRVGRALLSRQDEAGLHVQLTTMPPFDVNFTAQGALDGKLPAAAVKALKVVGGAVQVELSPVEANFDGGAAEVRLKAVIDALTTAGVYSEKFPPAVKPLLPAEQAFGNSLNDVIFLRQG